MDPSVGPVQRAIRTRLSTGQVFYTHARGAAFEIGDIDADGLVLLLGKGRHRTKFSWNCLEGIPGFLSGKGWVKAGGVFLPEGEPDTLDEYLKQHVYRQTSRWMARVLEASGLVQVESGPPLKVLLVAD